MNHLEAGQPRREVELLRRLRASAGEFEFYGFGFRFGFRLGFRLGRWVPLRLSCRALLGVALFQGAVWARTVAVIVASVSIIANFLWMPYYPIWSLTIIAFDVFVIWAATMHGRDITE